MKIIIKIILYTFIALTFLNLCIAQHPINEDSQIYVHRDQTNYTLRELTPYIPPCQCDCDDMIKSVKVSSTQTDDEVDLFGGYHIDGKYCQKFELLLSACNGAPINNFKITFDYGNAINAGNCFTEDQFFYKETAQGSSSLLGSVNRTLNENSVTFNLLDDYVPACTSKSITFYVCTSYMCSFSQLNVSVDLMNADGCPDRQLTFI